MDAVPTVQTAVTVSGMQPVAPAAGTAMAAGSADKAANLPTAHAVPIAPAVTTMGKPPRAPKEPKTGAPCLLQPLPVTILDQCGRCGPHLLSCVYFRRRVQLLLRGEAAGHHPGEPRLEGARHLKDARRGETTCTCRHPLITRHTHDSRLRHSASRERSMPPLCAPPGRPLRFSCRVFCRAFSLVPPLRVLPCVRRLGSGLARRTRRRLRRWPSPTGSASRVSAPLRASTLATGTNGSIRWATAFSRAAPWLWSMPCQARCVRRQR